MTVPASLSVVIPTYQRPDWIRRAIGSLAVQSRPPEEVIAVARDTDLPTHEAIAATGRTALPFTLRQELVSEPGFMPPVRAGLAIAQGDVVAVMDDDAEAEDGWAARLLPNYADDTVGAVGGRVINIHGGVVDVGPVVSRIGYVTALGRFVGNMYCRPGFEDPVEVDFLAGGNMSFRRDVARRLEFDLQLNRNVAQGYEVDIGLQVKAMGRKVLFDPKLAVRHYSAPRVAAGMRPEADADGIKWYSFNHVRVALRRLPIARSAVAVAYQLAIGERRAPGLLPFALAPLGRKLGFDMGAARAALSGRLLAVRGVLARS
jgi:GT2 family glycosyltransferase